MRNNVYSPQPAWCSVQNLEVFILKLISASDLALISHRKLSAAELSYRAMSPWQAALSPQAGSTQDATSTLVLHSSSISHNAKPFYYHTQLQGSQETTFYSSLPTEKDQSHRTPELVRRFLLSSTPAQASWPWRWGTCLVVETLHKYLVPRDVMGSDQTSASAGDSATGVQGMSSIKTVSLPLYSHSLNTAWR